MNKIDEIEEALKKLELLRLRASTHASISNCQRTMQDWIDSDAEFISKALTQLAALREDFVMVPREPTQEMYTAGERILNKAWAKGYEACPEMIYKAMIQAAQTKEKPND